MEKPKKGAGCQNVNFDAKRKAEFLVELKKCGLRIPAAQVIGVHPQTVSNHYTPNGAYYDEQFEAAYNDALQAYRESIVLEVHRRGMKGVKKALYYQGKRVKDDGGPVSVTDYSDPLLLVMLRRHNPEFNDKRTVQTEHSGTIALAALESLSQESRDQVREILEREARLSDAGTKG